MFCGCRCLQRRAKRLELNLLFPSLSSEIIIACSFVFSPPLVRPIALSADFSSIGTFINLDASRVQTQIFHIRICGQCTKHSLQCAIIPPFGKSGVHRLPGAIHLRQFPPLRSAVGNPKHPFEHFSIIFPRSAPEEKAAKEKAPEPDKPKGRRGRKPKEEKAEPGEPGGTGARRVRPAKALRSLRCLDMKKRRGLFQNLRRWPGRRNGRCLANIARFLCCYSLVCATPFSSALKNIDFTGVFHVFLWQRP